MDEVEQRVQPGLEQRLQAVFQSVFHLSGAPLQDDWGPGTLEGWDSMGHLTLLAALEQEFKIKLEMDDLIAMDSVKAIKELLVKKEV